MASVIWLPSARPEAERRIWHYLRRLALACARLIGWFAAEPQRIRAALLGVGLCVGIGAALGFAVGTVTSRVVDTVLSTLVAQQQR
jgi:hypothetical protein